MFPMMLCEKGLARWPNSPSIGPSRVTSACTANPTNATIASRPFLISLTALASEFIPAGSSGKMAFFSPVFQAWKREVSRKPKTICWMATRPRMGIPVFFFSRFFFSFFCG